MKKAILMIMVLSGIVFAASFDRRSNNQNQGEPVFRVEVPQVTLPDGATAKVEATAFSLNGTIRQIAVTVNNNDGNATMTVQIDDDNDVTLWSVSAIAESATTVFQSMTRSGTAIPLNIPVTGLITIGVTPSGDPATSTGLVDVYLYGE